MAADIPIARVGESRLYSFSFSKFPEIIAGDTLTGTPVITVTPSTGLTIGSPLVSSPTVIISVTVGSTAGWYELLCKSPTLSGRILDCDGNLLVEPPVGLISLPKLKSYLGISQADVAEDPLLSLLLASTSAAIEEYCGRTFASTIYTGQIYQGNSQQVFALRNRPVTAISALYLDNSAYWGTALGSFPASTLLVEGVDYALDRDQPDGSSRSGLVYRIGGLWQRPQIRRVGTIGNAEGAQVGNIKISYTAGFSVLPINVELAAMLAIAKVRRTAPYGQALASESYKDTSYSLFHPQHSGLFMGEVGTLLSRYRNLTLC